MASEPSSSSDVGNRMSCVSSSVMTGTVQYPLECQSCQPASRYSLAALVPKTCSSQPGACLFTRPRAMRSHSPNCPRRVSIGQSLPQQSRCGPNVRTRNPITSSSSCSDGLRCPSVSSPEPLQCAFLCCATLSMSRDPQPSSPPAPSASPPRSIPPPRSPCP